MKPKKKTSPPKPIKPVKAYKNLDFLTSPDARSVRLLSEFQHPLGQFRREGIRDTIVFFGSARIPSRNEAMKRLKHVKQSRQKGAVGYAEQLEHAAVDLEMSHYYEDAVELSRKLTLWSKKLFHLHRFVVCSGGGPGIMEAANKGAYLAKGRSVGLNISLPFDQYPNPFISPELNFEFHYFFMRKFWFVYLAKAFVMFPGGFGTYDELMEVLTLLQTSKIKKKVTVVLYGREYWEKVFNFKELARLRLISQEDLKLFTFADTPNEAYEHLITELQKNYPKETEQA